MTQLDWIDAEPEPSFIPRDSERRFFPVGKDAADYWQLSEDERHPE